MASTAPSTTTPTTTRPAAAPTGAARDRVIRFLEARIVSDPEDTVALNRLSGEYLARYRDGGDDADLHRAARAAGQSLDAVPGDVNPGGLAARARAAIALHRFADTRDAAARLAALQPDKRYPFELLGDALLELGDTDGTATAYAKLARGPDEPPDPTTEGRLARLALHRGDAAAARRHLWAAVDAAEALSPPDPVVLAWTRVRAGHLAFSTGDWEAAARHYEAALAARPDDWAALDHLAELRAAQARLDESAALYARVVARVPRPELFQSLGDVYRAMGRTGDAAAWHARALRGYLDAAAAGGTHYDHHLAGYYADVEGNGAEAAKWARRDLAARQTAAAYDGLAWALHHAGDPAGAAAAMDQALSRPAAAADAHILYHASQVYFRAARPADAKACLRRATAANPRFAAFHVHR